MPGEMIVSAGRVVHGPAATRSEHTAVLVRDGVIAEVGPADELSARTPASVPRRSFPRGTLLPGLIDAHVHLCFTGGPDPMRPAREEDDAALRERMAASAATLLATGVTTVRDLGDRNAIGVGVRDDVAAGRLPGPRMLVAGTPLTPPGGHCWFLGGEVDSPSAARDRIDALAAAGVDWIKVMASGGQNTPGGAAMWERQFSAGELRGIVEHAAGHGLPVAAHAHASDSVADAVEAGVRTIEHCTWMGPPADGGQRSSPDRRPDVVARMAERGIVACSGGGANRKRLAAVVGEERALELSGRTAWVAGLGVPVLFGTDAGIGAFDELPRSIAEQIELGFTPERALDVATTTGAELLGLGGVTGRIAPGLDADLLVVDGDPLSDPSALTRVELVLARGRPA